MAKEEEYLTLVEAALYVGVKRATLYSYMKDLEVKSIPMGPDGRRKFLALADVKKLKAYKERPWTVVIAGEGQLAEARREEKTS